MAPWKWIYEQLPYDESWWCDLRTLWSPAVLLGPAHKTSDGFFLAGVTSDFDPHLTTAREVNPPKIGSPIATAYHCMAQKTGAQPPPPQGDFFAWRLAQKLGLVLRFVRSIPSWRLWDSCCLHLRHGADEWRGGFKLCVSTCLHHK